MLTQYRTQRRLGQLTGSRAEILDPYNRTLRVDHPEIQHGIDPHGHVIFRDNVLAWHVQRNNAQIHAGYLLDTWDYDDQARPFDTLKAPQEENHATLVFRQNLDRRPKNQQEHHRGCDIGNQVCDVHKASFVGLIAG